MAGNLSIGRAWTDAAAFLRRERRIVAPLVLGLIAVPAVIAEMVQPSVGNREIPEPGLWMIVVLAMVVAMVVGQMAVTLLAGGWSNSPSEALRRSVRRLPVLVIAGLLLVGPSGILFLLARSITGTEGADIASAGAGAATLALILLLVLALTMIFIAVRAIPSIAVVASGEEGPVAAIKRTFRLTRGHFWKLFAFLILISIGFIVVAAAAGAIVGSLATLALGPAEPWSVAKLLIALTGGLLQAAFVSVYTAMIASITRQLEGEEVADGESSGI